MNDDRHDELSPSDLAPDAALDGWIGDAADAVEDDVRRANVPWDFAAMLARAHALDPSVVSEQAVAEAAQAEPVASLAQRRAHRSTRDDPAFARLVEDVRAATEHDAALRMNGVSVAPPIAARRPMIARVAIGVLALAAVLVLAFGVVQGVQVLRAERAAPADAALHQGGVRDDQPEQALVDDEPTRVRPTAPPRVAAPESSVVPEAPAAIDEAAAAPAVPTRIKPRAPKVVPPVVREPSLAERLAALDGEAHAAWKANDFATAQKKFEALIDLAGTSRLADLAYGDLFTLARRRSDRAGEVALWKTYLRTFPEGRFADDAQAGLCRRDASDRAACWRAYLVAFPEGSYRAQAEREAKAPGAGEPGGSP